VRLSALAHPTGDQLSRRSVSFYRETELVKKEEYYVGTLQTNVLGDPNRYRIRHNIGRYLVAIGQPRSVVFCNHGTFVFTGCRVEPATSPEVCYSDQSHSHLENINDRTNQRVTSNNDDNYTNNSAV
jgi:hypothetical protein